MFANQAHTTEDLLKPSNDSTISPPNIIVIHTDI